MTSAAISSLLSRRSVPALQLTAPGPSSAELELALEAALRAPDHGALRPWRLVLIEGAARAHLSALFVRQMQQRVPPPPAGKIERARTMPLTAPLVIAVGARILRPHKVPEVEQLLACGAAVMNLMNALHAQGFGAIWLTGDNAYDATIATAIGFGVGESCLGFLYVGTPVAAIGSGTVGAMQASVVRRPDGLVRAWNGDAPIR